MLAPGAQCSAAPGELGECVVVGLRRHTAGPVESELAHVGALPVSFIAAMWLAERLVGPRHVQHVVDDLEEQAEFGGKTAQRRSLRLVFDP